MSENEEQKGDRIPYSTVVRLSSYLRVLERMLSLEIEHVSSSELAEESGVSSYLVRKDLNYFGEFGVRGFGYNVEDLIAEIKRILGLEIPRRAVLAGVGNLGRALVGYQGFDRHGFNFVALFDSDPDKLGTEFQDLKINDIQDMQEVLEGLEEPAEIGVITVPAFSAQFVADLMVDAGLEGVLNFAPVKVDVPEEVAAVNVDLTSQLELLSYYIENDAEKPAEVTGGE